MQYIVASKGKKMNKLIALIIAVFSLLQTRAQEIRLLAGMKFTESGKIRAGHYSLPAGRDTLFIAEGDNLVLDFSGVILSGAGKGQLPDAFSGVALLIRNAVNVTIRNLKAGGYKIALMARNVKGLKIEHCDFSYNYRQRLNSTQEREDLSDWMSYHQNEKDEWLRYGAGIYLRDCEEAVISGNRVTGGQNGLMMTRCNNGRVYNNDFSFNSGIGIGIYRSSGNQFCYNRLNFNVRGYSHGVYNRGQDSAGFLVYEQSSNNIFYRNSATHSGDGFFLWAGQTTMDSGQGGCNDNEIRENDFSYAPTNGVEVTFSRVKVIRNRIYGCDHGIWGGYSFDSEFRDNKFRDNRIAVAIEHGVHNRIGYNLFSRDREAIRLWARKEQPADWGYARLRDTRSADYTIYKNSFNHHERVFSFSLTDSIRLADNSISGPNRWKADSTVTALDSSGFTEPDTTLFIPPSVPVPADPFAGNARLAGRDKILMTSWGPYDYRYPLIWNTNPVDTSDLLQFDLLGPAGSWRVKNYRGVEALSVSRGVFPAKLTARKIKSALTDILIELEYAGKGGVGPFGQKIAAGEKFPFRFRKFFQPVNWELDFYAYDSLSGLMDPKRTLASLDSLLLLKTEKTDRLKYAWWGGIRVGQRQYPQFITLARGAADFKQGTYELSVTWDDAVRIWLDGELILDEWEPAKYKFDESPNRKIVLQLNGNHNFRVEHVELKGFAALSLDFRIMD